MEKQFFTLKEIQNITGLSERTLRRYLKEKKLIGYKVGGEWRFSKEQLKNLFKEQTFNKNFAKAASLDAKRFINGEYQNKESIAVCSIIDLFNKTEESIQLIKQKILDISQTVDSDFNMKFISNDEKTRITLIGNIHVISKIMKMVEDFND